HETRQELQEILQEVRAAEPYPDDKPWEGRLAKLADRLDRAEGPGLRRSRWFRQELAGFAERSRADAVRILQNLDQRLGLLEESQSRRDPAAVDLSALSTEQIKSLLPPEDSGPNRARPDQPKLAPPRPENKRPAREDLEPADLRRRQGPGMVSPQPEGGFSESGWMVLAGMLVLVLLVAGMLAWRGRPRPVPARRSPSAG